MLDSIQGSLEGAERMPISARLRDPGGTPRRAITGVLAARAEAASGHMGIVSAGAARSGTGKSPSRTSPSRLLASAAAFGASGPG
ncbi:MAG: hypothetical protein LAQ30_32725 [Acidobacteriia bacterium]|nr:hypothetical protein [Terriglobia bacterium]